MQRRDLAMRWVLLCATIVTVSAQASPTGSPGPAPPEPGLEAVQRSYLTPDEFVYQFSLASTLAASSFGSVQTLFAGDTPALGTLPNQGLGQAFINLNPCAVWTPHTHPRASEFLFVAQGNLSIGFKEENPGRTADGQAYGGRFFNYTVPQGSTVVIPQGLMHYAINDQCQQGSIISAFDNRDPGTVSAAQTLFSLPTRIIAAATGLDAVSINLVQSKLSQLSVLSYDLTCLSNCKLPIPTGNVAPTPPTPQSRPSAQASGGPPANGPSGTVEAGAPQTILTSSG